MVNYNKKLFRLRYSSDSVFDAAVHILVVLILLTVLYPLYFVIIASISEPDAVNSGRVLFFPVTPGIHGYKYILNDNRIWLGYRNTILYTICGTLVGLITTLPGAYALSRRDLRGGGIIMKVLVFTMYFQGGIIPTYMLIRNLGLINTPYVMMIIGSFTVFNLIIARTYFRENIPEELLEAAVIDGCGTFKFFYSVVLPVSQAIIGVIALYYTVGHWNSFFPALLYLYNQKLYPLQLILRDILLGTQALATSGSDVDNLRELTRIAESIKYSIIIVSSLPVLVAYPFLQRYFVKGVMIGSIKG
ncbi:MAG: carbohydrate ABC transporter permease [Treponema sp.]|nr:carbohydrate ABC transporter permease [Treponema sp.]